MNKCKKCSYEWKLRIENPKECPRCKSRNWNNLDSGICSNCGKTFMSLHRHHIKPLNKGGSNKESNIIKVCASCHRFLHKKLNNKSRGWK